MDSRNFGPLTGPMLRRAGGGDLSAADMGVNAEPDPEDGATPAEGSNPNQQLEDMMHNLMSIVWEGHSPDEPLDLNAVQADPNRMKALQALVKMLNSNEQFKDEFIQEFTNKLGPTQVQSALEKMRQVGVQV